MYWGKIHKIKTNLKICPENFNIVIILFSVSTFVTVVWSTQSLRINKWFRNVQHKLSKWCEKSQFWHFFPMIGGWAGRFGGCRKQKQSQHIHARSGGWDGNEAKAYNDRLGSRHHRQLIPIIHCSATSCNQKWALSLAQLSSSLLIFIVTKVYIIVTQSNLWN